MNIPTEKIVKGCDASCQQIAPLKMDGTKLKVQFDYPKQVGIVVGVMNESFKKTWWLNEDANSFTNKYNSIFTNKLSTVVEVPSEVKKTGWLFWVSSVVPVNELDWANGIYEFRYFKYEIKEEGIISPPLQFARLTRNSSKMDRLYPNQAKLYGFQSSSKWGSSSQDRYALCVKIEDFDSSRSSYDYHTMLQYGGNPCRSNPLDMSVYTEMCNKMNVGSISWSGEHNGVYYDFSTQVTRLLKVKESYNCSCWYLWVYNFGKVTIPRMRITYVGPPQ